MPDEVEPSVWLRYAEENVEPAKVLLERDLQNPCLQNAQQAVEKALKAGMLHKSLPLKRTHSIQMLVGVLSDEGIGMPVTEDECDLLDSVSLPSKYPLGSALPGFEPTRELCQECVRVASRVVDAVSSLLPPEAAPEDVDPAPNDAP